MCLAADVPLIESGTTGFNGQVQVIKKGKTACYDCNPKTTPKTYAVCTIRSTPSQPIHCIVWGKSYLLPELFGVSEDETPDLNTAADSENAEEIEKLKEEAQALKRIRESMDSDDFVKQVFDKVFHEDIERLRKMEDMWKSRKAPTALRYETLLPESAQIPISIAETDQRPWTINETFVVFKESLHRLSNRYRDEQAAAKKTGAPASMITFDKDDTDTLDFVAAAANLRSIIFGIEPKSKFDIKQMAGNIIPAIATTNAMVAGLCVMQAFKVLKGDYGRTKMVFLDRGNMSAGPSDPPNPHCAVCGVAMSRIQVDPERATLNDLVEGVLKRQLGYGEDISVMNELGLVFDPDMEDNLEKTLAELEIKDASFVLVRDEADEPRVDLQLAIQAKQTEDDVQPVVLVQREGEKLEIAMKPKKTDMMMDGAAQNGIETVVNGAPLASTIAKRKRDADDAESLTPAKKTAAAAAPATPAEHETIVLDEEEGAITIDDD